MNKNKSSLTPGQLAKALTLCAEAAMFKDKLGRVGLYRTMHKMDQVVKEIGFECGEHIEKLHTSHRTSKHHRVKRKK